MTKLFSKTIGYQNAMFCAIGIAFSTSNQCAGSVAGCCFLGGGSIDDYNTEVWEALKDSTGLSSPKVAVFCSGAGSYADAYDAYNNDGNGHLSWQNLFEYHGMDPTFVPIAIDNYQDEMDNPDNIAIVNNADIVWFNGGDQSRHARCLLNDNGSDTPLMTAVRNAYADGATIAGSSAGAAIQSELSYGEGDSYGYLEANGMVQKQISDISLQDPNDSYNGGFITGFGFTSDIDAVVDTHVDGRGRIGRMAVAIRDLNASLAIGVYEDSAVIIENGIGEVFGTSGILVVDGTYASYPNSSYFEALDLETYSLSAGDVIDFNNMQVDSSKSLITNPYYSKARDNRDIFDQDNFKTLMERLIDSKENIATGEIEYYWTSVLP